MKSTLSSVIEKMAATNAENSILLSNDWIQYNKGFKESSGKWKHACRIESQNAHLECNKTTVVRIGVHSETDPDSPGAKAMAYLLGFEVPELAKYEGKWFPVMDMLEKMTEEERKVNFNGFTICRCFGKFGEAYFTISRFSEKQWDADEFTVFTVSVDNSPEHISYKMAAHILGL